MSSDANESDDPLTFLPLIRRNSRLPASFVRTVYRSHPQQSEVRIAVDQVDLAQVAEAFVGYCFSGGPVLFSKVKTLAPYANVMQACNATRIYTFLEFFLLSRAAWSRTD